MQNKRLNSVLKTFLKTKVSIVHTFLIALQIILPCFLLLSTTQNLQGQNFISDGYLKAIEMNPGDTLYFLKKNGEVFRMELLSSSAQSICRIQNPIKNSENSRLFRMHASLKVNNQTVQLSRIVSAQQSFYEPFCIDGVCLFFDATRKIDEFIHDTHGSSTGLKPYPKKEARFAF